MLDTPRMALAACAAAACALASPAGAVTDFRLPPSPSEQQPAPDRQGPVAPDVPESRARPTPSPTPTAVVRPDPAITVPPVVTPPAAGEAATPRTVRTGAPAPTRPVQTPAAEAAESPPPETARATPALPAPTATAASDLSLPTPTVAAPEAPDEGTSSWLWALLAVALGGGLAFAARRWWQRRRIGIPLAVPAIERPRLAPDAGPTPGASAPAGRGPAEPLQVALEPLRLSLTLMNATLAYRLEIANRGAAPIENLAIAADMISAHASMTREQQLAGPGNGAATVQRIERIEPGGSRIVEGEFRVPFSQIVPIRQGNAALLLPLARFRLEAEGAAPVVRSFVVGQPGVRAALQPFRLDLGPRVYPRLAQRAFA